MQKNKGNKIRLGIFITLALAAFIFLIYYIGRKQEMFSDTFRISGVFRDISGLEVGNHVRFSGINIGVIENIEMIADTAVRVDLVIEAKSRKFIKKDAKATIGSDGIMGGKIVLIIPGSAGTKEIQNKDLIATVPQVSMDDIMTKLKTSLNNVSVISEDLSAIMTNMRSGKGAMGKLFMDPATAQNLNQSIVNIKEGAGGFKQNMDAASHSFLLRGYLKRKERKKLKELEKQKQNVKKN